MKLVRIILLLLIFGIAVYCWWFVYGVVFELLDFQIGAYRILLQAGEQVWVVKDTVGWVVEQVVWLFGDDTGSQSSSFGEERVKNLEEKLQWFERKLKLVSGAIWAIAGLLVWKILSDIVFGFNNLIKRVGEFVK